MKWTKWNVLKLITEFDTSTPNWKLKHSRIVKERKNKKTGEYQQVIKIRRNIKRNERRCNKRSIKINTRNRQAISNNEQKRL